MSATEPEYVVIGEILAPWGNKGKTKVAILTDFPQRFAPSSKVYVNQQLMTVDSAQWHKGGAIIKFSDVNCPAEAKKLRGQTIEIHRSQLKPLPEGQYYLFQIIGLEVWTTGGKLLGVVTEIQTAAGSDTYLVRGDREEILIPATEDIIKSINLDKGQLVIEPIEGLLSLNSKSSEASETNRTEFEEPSSRSPVKRE